MSVAFGIPQAADGTGTTAQDMRRILAALYPNPGVISGLAVSGDTTLSYRVGAGVAACSRGGSDGRTLAWFPGGRTPAVAANAAGNPRVDVVWLCAHDASQGDADNLVALGVTQGTPAASPAAPAIPGYATRLGAMLVPAGATTTANAARTGGVDYAVPYGASLGVLMSGRDTANGVVELASPRVAASGTVSLPTDRLVQLSVSVTMGLFRQGPNPDGSGAVYFRVHVDGTQVWSSEFAVSSRDSALTQCFQRTIVLSAGRHTVDMRLVSAVGGRACRFYSSDSWAGQTIQAVDMGPVR